MCANGESVELFLNGKSLGVRTDKYLAEWSVPYVPGTLRAVAQCGGKTVEHTLATAGEPASLRIETTDTNLAADGADIAEITVTVLDAAGNPVLDEDGFAVFRVEGAAVVRGIGGIPCTPVLGGIGRILVQATNRSDTVTIRAAYRGLKEETLTLTIG